MPSLENACRFFKEAVSMSEAVDVPLMWFEFNDEAWKAPPGSVERAWGLTTTDAGSFVLKGCMGAVFAGERSDDTWSGGVISCGAGPPTFELTTIPAYGSFDDISGRVCNVVPANTKVAAVIRVNSRYWSKPTAAQPSVPLYPDGSMNIDVTTGGIDQTATSLHLFALPADFDVPVVLGGSALPPALAANASATATVLRVGAALGPENQPPSGTLTATAVVSHPSGASVMLTYRWTANDAVLRNVRTSSSTDSVSLAWPSSICRMGRS